MTAISPDPLVILLHGIRAKGADLSPLAETLGRSLPRAVFAMPNAPYPFDGGTGHQWFSIDETIETSRIQRIEDARPAFDEMLSSILDRHGLTERLDRVVLFGYSQGCGMALDALLSSRWPVRAVVGFSGRFVAPRRPLPAPHTRVLLVHGADDPVIPPSETENAYKVLRDLDIDTQKHFIPGVGHVISPEATALALAFLLEVFGE